jgi:hypothetical protein
MHTKFHSHKCLHNICSFLHVELVNNLEVNDLLAADFGSVNVGPVDILFNIKAKAAKIACNSPACPIKLEVGIDVSLATRTTKG